MIAAWRQISLQLFASSQRSQDLSRARIDASDRQRRNYRDEVLGAGGFGQIDWDGCAVCCEDGAGQTDCEGCAACCAEPACGAAGHTDCEASGCCCVVDDLGAAPMVIRVGGGSAGFCAASFGLGFGFGFCASGSAGGVGPGTAASASVG